MSYHDKLCIPANTKEGHSSTSQFIKWNARKSIDNVGHTGKLIEPVFHGSVESPPQLGASMSAQ